MSDDEIKDGIVEADQSPPKWAPKERGLWIELYQDFLQTFTHEALEDSSDLRNYNEEELREAVGMAGRMADWALWEVQFRFAQHVRSTARRVPTPRSKR